MFIGEKGIENALSKGILEPNEFFNKAKVMLLENRNDREIKFQTGCEKLLDGHIRYEIVDDIIIPPTVNVFSEKNIAFLIIEYVNSDELYGKIPFDEYVKTKPFELRKIYSDMSEREKERVRFLVEKRKNPENTIGGIRESEFSADKIFGYLTDFYPNIDEWEIDFKNLGTGHFGYTDQDKKLIALDTSLSTLSIRNTLIHEMQHQIQGYEEWESGSNLWLANNTMATCEKISTLLSASVNLDDDELRSMSVNEIFQRIFLLDVWKDFEDERFCARICTLLFGFDECCKKLLRAYEYYEDIAKLFKGRDIFKVYEGRHGEVEARNSAFRSMFDDNYRRTHLFNDTIDIPILDVYTTLNVWEIFGIRKSEFFKYKDRYRILLEKSFNSRQEVDETLKTLELECCLLKPNGYDVVWQIS